MSNEPQTKSDEWQQTKKRISSMLLEELKADQDGWYYISVASDNGFEGGYVLKAKGPTHAWIQLHGLGWVPSGVNADTQTYRLPETVMDQIPESQRWRRLTADEARNLGKG